VLHQLGQVADAIMHMRLTLADAPQLSSPPKLVVALQRVAAHRLLANWLGERGDLGDAQEAERQLIQAVRLLEAATGGSDIDTNRETSFICIKFALLSLRDYTDNAFAASKPCALSAQAKIARAQTCVELSTACARRGHSGRSDMAGCADSVTDELLRSICAPAQACVQLQLAAQGPGCAAGSREGGWEYE
jgi:hypothetical protein